MPDAERITTIHGRTPESAAMVANTKRAMAITARMNRLTFNDADEVRTLFCELTGQKVDESFLLIPPFYTAHGTESSEERRFGQGCVITCRIWWVPVNEK